MVDKTVILSDLSEIDADQRALFTLFESLGIAQTTYRHAPIFTVDEGIALDLPGQIPGQHGKSLFLKSKDGTYWLIVACETNRADLKKLAETLGAKRFSFASPDKMLEILRVVPGSATPFALMFDAGRQVNVFVDHDFLNGETCVFHPLRNTHSTAISTRDLIRFIEHLGYQPVIGPIA